MNKAVLYVRVSSAEQVQHGASLDAQEDRLRAYATLSGLEVLEVIRDEGVSASVPLRKRLGGARLVSLLGKKATHVVALKLDRVFRCVVDALSQTKEWDKQGIRLHLVDMGGAAVDTGSAMGRFFLTTMAGFAELERGLVGERTKAVLAYKKAQGEVYGNVPLGFDRDGNRLTENTQEAALIARIRGLRAEGLSYGKIAATLNDEGLTGKKGGRFHACTIRTLLKRVAAA